MTRQFNLEGGTKVAAFTMSNNEFDYIQGPLGSGKTKAACIRLMRHAVEQDKSPIDGMRYSRFFLARNTMPDLKRSTIRTWLETFPEETYGRFTYGGTMGHKIEFDDVRTQFDFISLDKPDDVRKLRSVEYTGGFFNEAPFIEKELVDESTSRHRYPPKEHCVPHIDPTTGTWALDPITGEIARDPKWCGILMDGNAPDEDHWLASMTGQVDPPPGIDAEERLSQYSWPPSWGLYMQPPAMIERLDSRGTIVDYEVNPKAENLSNLPSNYYQKLIIGKSRPWIDSRLMNRVALVVEGQPVWPMFRREYHVAAEALKPVPGHEVTISLDFGRIHPAALFSQEINNRINVQYEMLGFNEPASVFAPRVKRFVEQNYRGCPFRAVGDPKGNDKGQAHEQSSYDVFKFHGLPVTAAPVKLNNIEVRTASVAYALNDNPSGISRLVISPLCRTLVVGMSGRYFLTREETGELRPDKGKYSHLCDCLQYLCLFLGEGRRMIGLEPVGQVQPMRIFKGRQTMRRVIG